ncbi:hypothetical protein G1C96_0591 [Bifidobacterium sp. DSM 109958]|uniref:Uncharacterized protein n=1 Tax=Bifidobacterium moraviense TaxID=2675323 RepID=A0A7Y0F107_9BIFI|nr:hypothetical protein [Bifidobacterium sp. DSM 109958]NMN00014.1 hypothetical protein [Bifidobacterium sp. DSM 109958]
MMTVERDARWYRPALVLGVLNVVQWAASYALLGSGRDLRSTVTLAAMLVVNVAMAACAWRMAASVTRCKVVTACCAVDMAVLLVSLAAGLFAGIDWRRALGYVPGLAWYGVLVAVYCSVIGHVRDYRTYFLP